MHDGTKVRAQASGGSFRREKTVCEHLERARQVVAAMTEEPRAAPLSRREAARRRAERERKEKVERAWEQPLQQLQQGKGSEQEKLQTRVSLTDPEAPS